MPDRSALWEYYERRAAEGVRGTGNARQYWAGLGLNVTAEEIEAEAGELAGVLEALPPATFVEIGAGPGTFTRLLPGWGVALDQSDSALRVLLDGGTKTPALRADAFALPLRQGAVERVFATHIYGLLPDTDRRALLEEARRVSRELVVLDAGRPGGVPAEQVQNRTLAGRSYEVYRRHFDAAELASELEGTVLFSGRFYVLVAARFQ
jgi:SAM-dependent methyltransferase